MELIKAAEDRLRIAAIISAVVDYKKGQRENALGTALESWITDPVKGTRFMDEVRIFFLQPKAKQPYFGGQTCLGPGVLRFFTLAIASGPVRVDQYTIRENRDLFMTIGGVPLRPCVARDKRIVHWPSREWIGKEEELLDAVDENTNMRPFVLVFDFFTDTTSRNTAILFMAFEMWDDLSRRHRIFYMKRAMAFIKIEEDVIIDCLALLSGSQLLFLIFLCHGCFINKPANSVLPLLDLVSRTVYQTSKEFEWPIDNIITDMGNGKDRLGFVFHGAIMNALFFLYVGMQLETPTTNPADDCNFVQIVFGMSRNVDYLFKRDPSLIRAKDCIVDQGSRFTSFLPITHKALLVHVQMLIVHQIDAPYDNSLERIETITHEEKKMVVFDIDNACLLLCHPGDSYVAELITRIYDVMDRCRTDEKYASKVVDIVSTEYPDIEHTGDGPIVEYHRNIWLFLQACLWDRLVVRPNPEITFREYCIGEKGTDDVWFCCSRKIEKVMARFEEEEKDSRVRLQSELLNDKELCAPVEKDGNADRKHKKKTRKFRQKKKAPSDTPCLSSYTVPCVHPTRIQDDGSGDDDDDDDEGDSDDTETYSVIAEEIDDLRHNEWQYEDPRDEEGVDINESARRSNENKDITNTWQIIKQPDAEPDFIDTKNEFDVSDIPTLAHMELFDPYTADFRNRKPPPSKRTILDTFRNRDFGQEKKERLYVTPFSFGLDIFVLIDNTYQKKN